jgi:hypothetical protein
MKEELAVLAYVFCHSKQAAVAAEEYERRQRAFHAALAASPPTGYRGSFSAAISGAPWAARSGAAYEDWYRVDDFTALGKLNEGAISGSRSASHDAAGAFAAAGTGALYGLRLGSILEAPRHASWFGKPAGVRYAEFFDRLTPHVQRAHAALWMRQMVLGPSPEFCLQSAEVIALPAELNAIQIALRPIWPEG